MDSIPWNITEYSFRVSTKLFLSYIASNNQMANKQKYCVDPPEHTHTIKQPHAKSSAWFRIVTVKWSIRLCSILQHRSTFFFRLLSLFSVSNCHTNAYGVSFYYLKTFFRLFYFSFVVADKNKITKITNDYCAYWDIQKRPFSCNKNGKRSEIISKNIFRD